MPEQIGIAIVGYGKVAHLHAQAINNLETAHLVAVCGRRLEGAREFGAKYNIPAYNDLSEMLATESIQAITVCTPHPAHAQPTIAAAQNGVHVLVEKPLASSLADCDAMIEAGRANHVKIGIISQRRFYEPVQRMKRAIDAGKIGAPILAQVVMYGWRDEAYYESNKWRGTWDAEGGGVLVNQAPHQLDLLQWFMGPIESLFGFWDNFNHPYIEVDDTAVAVLRFKNGSLGNIIVSNSQKPGIYGKVHVHGKNGASVGVQTEGGAMFIAGMSDIAEPPK
jgi:predicted dehydrogenase